MKILMLCGSPRPVKSTSQYLLQSLKERLDDHKNEILMCSVNEPEAAQMIADNLIDAKAFLIAFPLYVDGIPAGLLKLLYDLKAGLQEIKTECKVYSIVNNGFYDARQNAIAIDIIGSFCEACGLHQGYAIGAGAGEMIQVAPLGYGPSKNLGHVMERLAEDILAGNVRDTIYVEPNFPRFLYRLAAHFNWRSRAKKNGLKSSDLRKQI